MEIKTPQITNLEKILQCFLIAYLNRHDGKTDKEWLDQMLAQHLPGKTWNEIDKISKDILIGTDKMESLSCNRKQFTKSVYNDEEWIYQKVYRDLRESDNQMRWLIAEQGNAIRISGMNIIQSLSGQKNFHRFFRSRNDNGNNGNDVAFHLQTTVENIQRKLLAHYTELLQNGIHPIYWDEEELRILARQFSKNASLIGMGSIMLSAEFCVARLLQQHGFGTQQRDAMLRAMFSARDRGLCIAITGV